MAKIMVSRAAFLVRIKRLIRHEGLRLITSRSIQMRSNGDFYVDRLGDDARIDFTAELGVRRGHFYSLAQIEELARKRGLLNPWEHLKP